MSKSPGNYSLAKVFGEEYRFAYFGQIPKAIKRRLKRNLKLTADERDVVELYLDRMRSMKPNKITGRVNPLISIPRDEIAWELSESTRNIDRYVSSLVKQNLFIKAERGRPGRAAVYYLGPLLKIFEEWADELIVGEDLRDISNSSSEMIPVRVSEMVQAELAANPSIFNQKNLDEKNK